MSLPFQNESNINIKQPLVVHNELDTPIKSPEVNESSDDEPEDSSDGESDDELGNDEKATVQSIQEAININHPFGLRIWKPALYKKNRSIQNTAETALLETPGAPVARKYSLYLSKGNLLWLFTGNWIACVCYLAVALILFLVVICASLSRGVLYAIWGCRHPGARYYAVEWLDKLLCLVADLYKYAKVLLNLANYMLWPFGKFVHLLPPQNPELDASRPEPLPKTPSFKAQAHEPQETEPLLSSTRSEFVLNVGEDSRVQAAKKIPEISVKQIWSSIRTQGFPAPVFYFFALVLLAPVHIAISTLAWLSIFSIPMAKLHIVLLKYLLLCPLRLKAEKASAFVAAAQPLNASAMHDEHLREYYSDALNVKHLNAAVKPARKKWSLEFIQQTPVASGSQDKPLPTIPHRAAGPYERQMPPPVLTPNIAPLLQHPQSTLLSGAPSLLQTQDVVLCIYHAMGWRYYKYTISGINIIFINLIAIVCFTLFDGYVVAALLPDSIFAAPKLIFALSLVSVVPLAYFIGMAVSSITAETGSLALGAVINATFGSVIEIILYAIAILKGKNELVEGAIVGSFFCGLLTLPGVSMVSGAFFNKEQRFNAKSAGVTATMLIVAVAGCFTPTFFQSIYGMHDLQCDVPVNSTASAANMLENCKFVMRPPAQDEVYQSHTKPLIHFCAGLLVLMYVIGLWFTLRTHSKQIYARTTRSPRHKVSRRSKTPSSRAKDEAAPKQSSPRSSHASLKSTLSGSSVMSSSSKSDQTFKTASTPSVYFSSALHHSHFSTKSDRGYVSAKNGHNSPNWSTGVSIVVLLLSTVSFSLLAEIIVDQVDHVFGSGGSNQKFLGLTLFALVPSVTEFYNAIAFAMYGNVGLSLEIGSAYVVQVALVQVPVVVAFSATIQFWCSLFNLKMPDPKVLINGFNLIFPYWDTYSTIFSVFLLAYLYNEGKSNYFKGSMLLCCYALILASYANMPN